jgi:hypothetical protein
MVCQVSQDIAGIIDARCEYLQIRLHPPPCYTNATEFTKTGKSTADIRCADSQSVWAD